MSRSGERLLALALATAFSVTACEERVDITGTTGGRTGTNAGIGTGTGGTSGTGATDARFVGQWSHTLLLQDNAGVLHASRTTWRFASNASASRAVVASNLTFGLVDSVVTRATWRIEGGRLAVSYLPAGSGEARFDYLFQGATLILGGIPFDRQ
jgi:hypothetical protein